MLDLKKMLKFNLKIGDHPLAAIRSMSISLVINVDGSKLT